MFRRIPIFDGDNDGPNDTWSKWGLGVVVPSLIAVFGTSRIIYQKATWVGRRGFRISLYGSDAIAFGIIVLAVALFLHAHYFIANSDRLAEYTGLVKIVALLTGLASFGWILVHLFSI